MGGRRPASGIDDAALIRRVAARIDAALIDRIADAMAAEMAAALPDAMSVPEFADVVRAANHGTVSAYIASLEHADVWTQPAMPPALAELALTLARRGDDINLLMKLARHGQAVFWPALMEEAERDLDDPAAGMRALATMFERFTRYMEGALEGAVAVYQPERDRRMRGAQTRREATVRALLAGEDVDPAAASKALGIELSRTHSALVLWDTSGDPDALTRLEAAARTVAAAFGSPRLILTSSGSRGLWAWLTTAESPIRPGADDLALGPGIHLAIGHPGRGVEGFRRSHTEAVAAQRVADLAQQAGAPVTWYEDVELASLLSRNPEAMKAFVERTLGDLGGRRPTDAKLRQTALAYLRSGCNATAAARLLGAHKNTVHYRLQQVDDLLGRKPLPEDAQLWMALTLAETLGDAALPD